MAGGLERDDSDVAFRDDEGSATPLSTAKSIAAGLVFSLTFVLLLPLLAVLATAVAVLDTKNVSDLRR